MTWQDVQSRKRAINEYRRDLALEGEAHNNIVDEALALQSDGCPHRDMIRACQRKQNTTTKAVEWVLEQMMIGLEDRERRLLLTEGEEADLVIAAKKGALGVLFDWVKLAGAAAIGAAAVKFFG